MQLMDVQKNKGNAVFKLADSGNAMLELNIQECFRKEGYRLDASNGDVHTFIKGKFWVRMLLGAFVKYFKFTVTIQKEGGTTIYFDKKGSGFSGGLIGVAQLNKEFKRMTDVLESCLHGQ